MVLVKHKIGGRVELMEARFARILIKLGRVEMVPSMVRPPEQMPTTVQKPKRQSKRKHPPESKG